jgi:L-amino acid N-acyltransferase YncA
LNFKLFLKTGTHHINYNLKLLHITMNDKLVFRPLTQSDWKAVAEIYKQGIETGNATFQQEVPLWEDWDKGHLQSCRLIAEIDNMVAGWAALTLVSGRCVYAGVAEVSVYVSNDFKGKKVGSGLLEKLIAESESVGIWTLQAGIFPENKPSIRIHESLGFRLVGFREKIGKMDNVWRDTLLYERRSTKVGT